MLLRLCALTVRVDMLFLTPQESKILVFLVVFLEFLVGNFLLIFVFTRQESPFSCRPLDSEREIVAQF